MQSRCEVMTVHADDTIIVVEDDLDTRESLVDLLSMQGYEVMSAENGRRALDLLRTQPRKPCVILLDIMMPVMNGWEFLDALRADPMLSSIPVVVLTADASAQFRAGGASVAAFLNKPIVPQTLSETIARHC